MNTEIHQLRLPMPRRLKSACVRAASRQSQSLADWVMDRLAEAVAQNEMQFVITFRRADGKITKRRVTCENWDAAQKIAEREKQDRKFEDAWVAREVFAH